MRTKNNPLSLSGFQWCWEESNCDLVRFPMVSERLVKFVFSSFCK